MDVGRVLQKMFFRRGLKRGKTKQGGMGPMKREEGQEKRKEGREKGAW